MKYVWIVVAVIILVRIDMVLNFFEKTFSKVSQSQESELKPGELPTSSELIPLSADQALKVTPRNQFLTTLADFYVAPDSGGIERALDLLKQHPKIFDEKLDAELEVKIYRWREHIQQKNKLAYDFIYALMKILKGENLEMLRRFSTLLIDYDLPEFLNYNSLSGDATCSTSLLLADNLPDEEKYNELTDRVTLFQNFLMAQTTASPQKYYAEKCLTLLRFQVEKLKSQFEPSSEPTSLENEAPESPISAPTTTQAEPPVSVPSGPNP